MQSGFRLLLGIISLIIGAAIILWALYNVFVERLEGYSGPESPLALLLGGFGLAGLLFKYGWHSLLIMIGVRQNSEFEL
jgi:hypothetical protein